MNAHAAIRAAGTSPLEITERLEIVETGDRLAAVEAEWTRLWQACDGFVFQSHGWISAWWQTVGRDKGQAMRIGLVWSGERLVAVIPLAISRRKGVRFLEWAAGVFSDYGDILCAPECPEAALDALWTALCSGGGFDLVFINRLLPDAAAWRLLEPGKAHGFGLRPNHREEISSRISGDWPSGAAWLARRPKKVRHNHRRGISILEETGPVRFRPLGPDEPVGPVLERLAAMKRKWLEKTARKSELFDEGAPALAAFVEVLARAGILRLFVLEVGDTVVAVSVNFVQRNTMMAWVTTYDPDHARVSPGTILIFNYVQWSIDAGLGAVDLLCGSEAFKGRLATHTVPLRSVAAATTLRGSLALVADGVRQKLRARKEDAAEPA